MGNSSPVPESEVSNFVDLKKLPQLKNLDDQIKEIVLFNYGNRKENKLILNPSKKSQLVLISDRDCNLSIDLYCTNANHKNSKTSWSGRFEIHFRIPRYNLKDPEMSTYLRSTIDTLLSEYGGQLNIAYFGAYGDGKSGSINEGLKALGSKESVQSTRIFETGDSDHSVTRVTEVVTVPFPNEAKICFWNVPGNYETKQSGVQEREPAKNYFQHLLKGHVKPNTLFNGSQTVPDSYNSDNRIHLVIFVIDSTNAKTLDEVKPIYAKYTRMCVDHKINYMFITTKFDNMSDRYLAFDGVAVNWDGSNFKTCEEDGHLFATLEESPEFKAIENVITSTFKNGVVFPMINCSDENRKKFHDDKTGILSIIQKNHVLRHMEYAVKMGIEAAKWQTRN